MTDVTSQTFRRWREAKGWGAPAVQAQPEIVHLVALLDRETAAPFAGSLEDALRKLAAGASAAGPRCTVAAAQRSRWGFSQRGSGRLPDRPRGRDQRPQALARGAHRHCRRLCRRTHCGRLQRQRNSTKISSRLGRRGTRADGRQPVSRPRGRIHNRTGARRSLAGLRPPFPEADGR